MIYWPPGPDVAIFYRHDDEKIPDPCIIVMGKIESAVEVFSVPAKLAASPKSSVSLSRSDPSRASQNVRRRRRVLVG